MPYLPRNTAVAVEVGPLIDDSDFKSLEETIAYNETNMDVDLLQSLGTSLTKTDVTLSSGGVNDWTHKGSGVYEVQITAAQNDSEGTLRLVGLCDGVLPFESPVYTVVPQMVYNALVAGSDKLEIDVNQVGGTAVPETSGKLHVLDDAGDAVANESKQDVIDGIVDNILTDTGSTLDTLIKDIPTIAEFEARTIVSGNYSTHDAAAVKTAIEAGGSSLAQILADTNELQIDDIPTTITALKAVADAIQAKTDNLPSDPADASVIAGLLATIAGYLNTEIQAILDDTNELQGDWADGGRLDNLLDTAAAGGAGDASEAKQNTIITHLTDIKGGTFNGATDSVEAIRNRGDAAWVTGGTGGGSETWVFTLTEAGSGEFVADASVWVTADEAGEGEVIASGYTDNFGKITFLLDTGTYYFWAEKSGWNFDNPYEQVIAASGTGSGTATRAGVPSGALSICNEAINLLGGQTITDFTDNTQEARLVEQFYTSAIKQTLRDYDWAFATKRSSELAVLDDEPEFGWSYQYQLPTDCIRVISVYGGPDFEIEGRVLLINESSDVYLKYVYLITDVSLFDALFRRALVRRLAADMAYPLTKKRDKEEELILLYERSISKAKSKDRKESHNVALTPAAKDSWTKR